MPSQFWALTPAEFQRQVEGYAWREERAQWRMAAIVAAIYDVHRDRRRRRRPITAQDILGRRARPAGARTPEAQLAALRRATLMLGGEVRTS